MQNNIDNVHNNEGVIILEYNMKRQGFGPNVIDCDLAKKLVTMLWGKSFIYNFNREAPYNFYIYYCDEEHLVKIQINGLEGLCCIESMFSILDMIEICNEHTRNDV